VEPWSCTRRLKVRAIEYIPLVTLPPLASENDHPDLTNRVRTSWLIVTFGDDV
jgi:hypothetical protein